MRLTFEKCGRAGQYRKQNLITQFGPGIPLPDLWDEIAKCEREGGSACGVYYAAKD